MTTARRFSQAEDTKRDFAADLGQLRVEKRAAFFDHQVAALTRGISPADSQRLHLRKARIQSASCRGSEDRGRRRERTRVGLVSCAPRPFVPVSVPFVDSSMYALSARRLSPGRNGVTVNRS